MMRLGDVIAKEQATRARRDRTESWLGQLGVFPGAHALQILADCESGAEAILAWQFGQKSTPDVDGCAFATHDVLLRLQVPCHSYRIDMVAERFVLSPMRLAIEVDGYEWHQLAEEKVQADYLRQRRLTAAGYTVIRFTAREVYRDPAECWRQVEKILEERG